MIFPILKPCFSDVFGHHRWKKPITVYKTWNKRIYKPNLFTEQEVFVAFFYCKKKDKKLESFFETQNFSTFFSTSVLKIL